VLAPLLPLRPGRVCASLSLTDFSIQQQSKGQEWINMWTLAFSSIRNKALIVTTPAVGKFLWTKQLFLFGSFKIALIVEVGIPMPSYSYADIA
jgi:hypothetical protein